MIGGMLIVDAHLDLAMNALEWNRDLTRPTEETRARERDLTDKPDRGRGTVSFAEASPRLTMSTPRNPAASPSRCRPEVDPPSSGPTSAATTRG